MKIYKKEDEVNLQVGKFGIFFKKPYMILDYLNDFLQALLFVSGSILYFFNDIKEIGTWCFLTGSILFASRPVIRIVHSIQFKKYMKKNGKDI